MSRSPLAGAVVVPAAPVGPLDRASTQETPAVDPLAGREVELSSVRPESGDALVVAYVRATAEAPPPPTPEG